MKRLILTGIAIALTAVLAAYPVLIKSTDPVRDVKTINRAQISIDYVDPHNGSIIAYVRSEAEENILRSLGFDTLRQPEPDKEYAAELARTTMDTRDPMNAYYSLDEYHTFMQSMVTNYPNLCQLVSIGNSHNNRPLYYLKISDNVSINENEPEIRLISSVHGDEVVGYDLLIRLIQLLTSEYGQNPRITSIVDNNELWINPMANPDGYILQQRYNAQGIDLNRNLPMVTGNLHPDGNQWATENIAFMDFSNSRYFSQSMNLHGGALVINYPWDYTYTLAPDNDLIIQMALAYSTNNTDMYNGQFNQGITNGAAWYVITGSVQDWSYGLTDCIDLTGEISNIKWPNASTLDSYWDMNRESLLSFIEFSQRGMHGHVYSETGEPLDATLSIAGNARSTGTDPDLGDFHRPLLGGEYSVTASATGYISQSQTITVPADGGVNINFELEEAQSTFFFGIVRNTEGEAVSGASISISTDPQIHTTSGVDGSFVLTDIYEGHYEIQIDTENQGSYQGTLIVELDNNHQVFLLGQPLFFDDFESGLANWNVISPWGIAMHGDSNVLMDSPGSNYANNINKSASLANPVSLTGISNAMVSFDARYALEESYDYAYLEASSNGTNWTELASFTGEQNSWVHYSFSLAAFEDQNCYLRYRIDTDSSYRFDGISIDNFRVSGQNANSLAYGDVTGNGVVDRRDMQAILDYCINLDPLQAIDPSPWEEGRLLAADVNADELITSLDAYLVYTYYNDPAYLFEAQSGEEMILPPVVLEISYQEGNLCFSWSNPTDFRAFNLSFGDPEQLSFGDLSPHNAVYWATNPIENKLALISVSMDQDLEIPINPSANEIFVEGRINGYYFSQYVQLSSSGEEYTNPVNSSFLAQNWPNPFNPTTTISFGIGKKLERVNLAVYNTRGQLVKSLVKEDLPQGNYRITWDGTDSDGSPVASGIYLYRLVTDTETLSRSMVLIK